VLRAYANPAAATLPFGRLVLVTISFAVGALATGALRVSIVRTLLVA
jgi:hypothetical protein